MKFLITPNSDYTSQAILTDDYTPLEVANGLHIKHIRADLEHTTLKTPVRVYAITGSKPPTRYFLLS